MMSLLFYYRLILLIKMRIVCFLLIIVQLLILMCSCKESTSDRITHLVKEWENREIIFPTQTAVTVLGRDTAHNCFMLGNKYSIVTYVDSVGCTSCKLQLRKWLGFIKGLDSLTSSSVPVLFFLHPKDKKEIITILDHEHFNYPVCIDENDSLNILNHFPQEMSFQTFLIDQDHKVIAIGNPVLNPKIRDLYFNFFLGEGNVEVKKVSKTEIIISEQILNMGDFLWKESQTKEIILKNIGSIPLVIDDIITSCGCITVKYDKKPIFSQDTTSIKVIYHAEKPEYFDKNITIYCNAESSPFRLKIKGNAK
ncbi:Protein of unknown function [Bacteroides sp. AR20]|nr:Protein of unknown function [Bacteroides sp. AR20]